jgi:hypothetical protein
MSETSWTGSKIISSISTLEASPEFDLKECKALWMYLLRAWVNNSLSPQERYSRSLLEILIRATRLEAIKEVIERVNRENFPERDQEGFMNALREKAENPDQLVKMIAEELIKALRYLDEVHGELESS